MVRFTTASVVITFALAAYAAAQTPTTQQVRDAIDALEKDPMSAREKGHTATIIKFAEDSPDVSVSLDPAFLPFTDRKENGDDKNAPLLLAAFVAGNVRSQLDSKKNADDTHAGLLTTFKVYHKIREAHPDYKDARLEELEAMEKSGKLKDHIAERQKQRAR